MNPYTTNHRLIEVPRSIYNKKTKKLPYESYRNDGKFFYDSSKLCLLDYEQDDYGSVPHDYKIEYFPHPLYFENSISHNRIVHIEGSKYDITCVKPTKEEYYNGFLYTIKHQKLDFEWYIFSEARNKKTFKKSLRKGTFEVYIDGAFDVDAANYDIDQDKTLLDLYIHCK